jgi:hypothetical protein
MQIFSLGFIANNGFRHLRFAFFGILLAIFLFLMIIELQVFFFSVLLAKSAYTQQLPMGLAGGCFCWSAIVLGCWLVVEQKASSWLMAKEEIKKNKKGLV